MTPPQAISAEDPPKEDSNVEMTTAVQVGATVSPALLSPALPDFNQGDSKLFLDICSGSTRPLSSAILAQHGNVLSFDILLDQRMDLLNDQSYEKLLRICSSGQISYGAASPSCAHYSRLKLHRPGPKALRTPAHLEGVPGLSSSELLQVQDSYMMLLRAVTCLTLIYQAGGHVHLEQPPTAMSWLEACVQSFLRLISAWCIVISACEYGKDWYKQWMFASSWEPISALGCLCPHPSGSHTSLVGARSETGEYLSRQTACYPEALAIKFANLVTPLLQRSSHDWKWDDINFIPRKKSLMQPPFGGWWRVTLQPGLESGQSVGFRHFWPFAENMDAKNC